MSDRRTAALALLIALVLALVVVWRFLPHYQPIAMAPHDDDQQWRLITSHEASGLIGKHVLAGITHLDKNAYFVMMKEVHGIVVRANPKEGVVIRRPDGTEYDLPPSLSGYRKAPQGGYTLRSTGEVVANPDYLVNYSRTQHDAPLEPIDKWTIK